MRCRSPGALTAPRLPEADAASALNGQSRLNHVNPRSIQCNSLFLPIYPCCPTTPLPQVLPLAAGPAAMWADAAAASADGQRYDRYPRLGQELQITFIGTSWCGRRRPDRPVGLLYQPAAVRWGRRACRCRCSRPPRRSRAGLLRQCRQYSGARGGAGPVGAAQHQGRCPPCRCRYCHPGLCACPVSRHRPPLPRRAGQPGWELEDTRAACPGRRAGTGRPEPRTPAGLVGGRYRALSEAFGRSPPASASALMSANAQPFSSTFQGFHCQHCQFSLVWSFLTSHVLPALWPCPGFRCCGSGRGAVGPAAHAGLAADAGVADAAASSQTCHDGDRGQPRLPAPGARPLLQWQRGCPRQEVSVAAEANGPD